MRVVRSYDVPRTRMVFKKKEILITVHLNQGAGRAAALTCDFSNRVRCHQRGVFDVKEAIKKSEVLIEAAALHQKVLQEDRRHQIRRRGGR